MSGLIKYCLWLMVVVALFFTVKYTVQSLFDFIILMWVSVILAVLPITLDYRGDKP